VTVPPQDQDPPGATGPSWGALAVLAVLAALPVLYFRIRLPAAADLAFHLAIAG